MDKKLKTWRRLPQIQLNIIRFGGIDWDNNIPSETTEEMMAILNCQNGAQAEQLLRQSMNDHNMSLEPGLYTALNKDIFVCSNDAGTPRNLTPFSLYQLKTA